VLTLVFVELHGVSLSRGRVTAREIPGLEELDELEDPESPAQNLFMVEDVLRFTSCCSCKVNFLFPLSPSHCFCSRSARSDAGFCAIGADGWYLNFPISVSGILTGTGICFAPALDGARKKAAMTAATRRKNAWSLVIGEGGRPHHTMRFFFGPWGAAAASSLRTRSSRPSVSPRHPAVILWAFLGNNVREENLMTRSYSSRSSPARASSKS